MVGVIMVAEEFGTGRGTLFDILELLFGEDYVVPCSFGELTGNVGGGALQRPAGRRAHRRRQRGGRRGRAPAGAAAAQLRGAEKFDRPVADGAAALRGEGAARLRADVRGEHDDRDQSPRRGEAAAERPARSASSPAARKMTAAETAEIRAWMADAGKHRGAASGAARDAGGADDVFDPFGEPPPFAGRREMIGMGEIAAGGRLRGGDRRARRVARCSR